jgi:hypothetical protein
MMLAPSAAAYRLSMTLSDLPSLAEAPGQTSYGRQGFAQARSRHPLFGIML